jgi:hypothetical protein
MLRGGLKEQIFRIFLFDQKCCDAASFFKVARAILLQFCASIHMNASRMSISKHYSIMERELVEIVWSPFPKLFSLHNPYNLYDGRLVRKIEQKNRIHEIIER